MYNSKIVFTAACVGMLLFGVTFITLGSVAPTLIPRFHLSQLDFGTLFSILPFGILVGSILFGPLCDKYGYKNVLVLSALLIFLGIQGIAFSYSLLLLKICIFFFGMGGGAINGATNALAADLSNQNKHAKLSLLGVFFGLGALGMPFVLGYLEGAVVPSIVLACVGVVAFVAALFFGVIKFPPPKQKNGLPIRKGIALLKDYVLILAAFFLFCQSSFEGLMNNWTTTYLVDRLHVSQGKALYALSLFVTGMTVMRLLTGSLFKKWRVEKLIFVSFFLSGLGVFLISRMGYFEAIAGLVLLGAGLAGGFPIMLGIVADRYAHLSATAFSIVLAIALLGNMLVNYIMGLVANAYGIHNLIYIITSELIVMILLVLIILKKKNGPRHNS